MSLRLRPSLDLLSADLDAVVEYDVPIGEAMTWYGMGGRAEVLVRPRSVEALQTLLRRCSETGAPLRVLGSGANLLVADEGVDGVVVHLTGALASPPHPLAPSPPRPLADPSAPVRIPAGASMERLVMDSALGGLSGLEPMAGIPASLGGAIRMNAGGKFGCIGDVVAAVGCLTRDGELVVHRREKIDFAYRHCSIVEPVILWADLLLTPDDPKRTHAKVKEIFAYKKASQPLREKSAGCVFKNPPDRDDPSQRRSAGELIERAGLKGFSIGGATISPHHANFFTVRPGTKADDLIALIDHAFRVVCEETGYDLEREIVIWRRGR